MLEKCKKRSERRRGTYKICQRRYDCIKSNTVASERDYYDESSIHRLTKRPYYTCGCSKKTHGRPKVSRGLCCIGDRERIFRHRYHAREFCRKAALDREHYDGRLCLVMGMQTHNK